MVTYQPRRVKKDWGHELWIHNSPMYCGKLLVLEPEQRRRGSSYHYHERKHETWYVQRGRVIVELDGVEHVLEEGAVLEIAPYVRHSFSLTPHDRHGAVIFEVSTQHFESDSIRLERA